jgi:hypothetical protein
MEGALLWGCFHEAAVFVISLKIIPWGLGRPKLPILEKHLAGRQEEGRDHREGRYPEMWGYTRRAAAMSSRQCPARTGKGEERKEAWPGGQRRLKDMVRTLQDRAAGGRCWLEAGSLAPQGQEAMDLEN